MNPKVTFLEPSHENLANYLCYLAKQISCGFYQDRRFLVLPRLIEKESRAIFFPDLPYTTKFWNNFASLKQNDFVFNFGDKIVESSGALLSHAQGEALRTLPIQSRWQGKEKEFWKLVNEFLPELSVDKINKIEVLPTPFGSVSSFFFERVGTKYNFKITVRTDFGPAQIAESILTNLIWIDHPTPNLALWHEVEATVDFLLTKSKLAKLFNYEYVPTIRSLPEISENFVAESEKYLEKLGFPITPTKIDAHFTQTEQRIFNGMISNSGKIVTYDQIGDWFWGENNLDKFSLYSVAKIMEKIRKKIKDQGIYQELIYTIRGQGYVLYD